MTDFEQINYPEKYSRFRALDEETIEVKWPNTTEWVEFGPFNEKTARKIIDICNKETADYVDDGAPTSIN